MYACIRMKGSFCRVVGVVLSFTATRTEAALVRCACVLWLPSLAKMIGDLWSWRKIGRSLLGDHQESARLGIV